jgi:malate dehydrogenase (oxaloacetate-decarboxylating)
MRAAGFETMTAMAMPDSARPRPAPTSASYSITVRLYAVPDSSVVGRLATAVSEAGGLVTAVDVSESRHDRITIDVTCSAVNGEHSEQIVAALGALPGVEVHRVSDRTFLLHLGGKISVESKVPLRTRDDLSMAYTPGVGRVSLALAAHPEDVSKLTIKGNSVAVVTDGSAVLGLGNIGPGAALPVMEGKAALFKRFADIDAWPICLDTQDTDLIVQTVQLIAPGFGGINLEDISAPRCFEIEARLRQLLDIPVFHDDQHGTAIVDLLLAAGVRHVLVWDREGVLSPTDERLSPAKLALAQRTNPAGVTGDLHDALYGADVFIGVSAPGVLPAEWIADMAEDPVVFALANPDPETDIDTARRYATILATGRSDYPNQINNVLAFPGVFRGLLDSHASQVSTEMLLQAASALAHCVSDDQLNPAYIVPSVFDPSVPQAVAAAVRDASGPRQRVLGDRGME